MSLPWKKVSTRLSTLAQRGTYYDRWRKIDSRTTARLLRYAALDVVAERRGGPVLRFERSFARWVEAPYALMTNNGSAALHSAYFAVGVGPGDEVIVPSYTFFASAAPMLPLGGVPVFCEIDPSTLTADPDDVEARITPRTRAICVVHLWGNPARMDRFAEIARRHNVSLIEDCSHAHGALYRRKCVGTWGDVGCFSMQGNKPVSGGEAGVATTASPELFDRMLALGHFPRTLTDQVAATFDIGDMAFGPKYRPHLYASVIAEGSLARIEELNERRRANYAILEEELAGSSVLETVKEYPEARRAGFFGFVLRYHSQEGGRDRTAFVKAARAKGIPLAVDPCPPLHSQPLFSKRLWREAHVFGRFHPEDESPAVPALPVTEATWQQLVKLPPFTKVSESAIRRCARVLSDLASG